jgi:hypothetical protein
MVCFHEDIKTIRLKRAPWKVACDGANFLQYMFPRANEASFTFADFSAVSQLLGLQVTEWPKGENKGNAFANASPV